MAVKPSKPKLSKPKPSSPIAGFGLDPTFGEKLLELLAACKKLKLDFRISQGLRTPQVQAKYYCQWEKRSPADIDAAAAEMDKAGAPWLASVLLEYRNIPRIKRWQTNALPGAGWHQWGEAADCYCYRKGKMVEDGADPCYQDYAEAAKKIGLTAGLYFSKPDAGHVQLRKKDGAADVLTWKQIDEVMKARFSEKPDGIV
jgi:peptidoglycan LD-endopeptidase CwlK